jgi:hypothetical protein
VTAKKQCGVPCPLAPAVIDGCPTATDGSSMTAVFGVGGSGAPNGVVVTFKDKDGVNLCTTQLLPNRINLSSYKDESFSLTIGQGATPEADGNCPKEALMACGLYKYTVSA